VSAWGSSLACNILAEIICVVRQDLSSLLIGYRTERSDNLSILQPIDKLEKFCRTTTEIKASGPVSTMQEIGPSSWTERGLTNRINQVTELFKCDWLILSPFKILDQFLASYTQGLKDPVPESRHESDFWLVRRLLQLPLQFKLW